MSALRSEPTLASGLLGEVRSVILPLQMTEGHMEAIQIIDIGKQRVMYAYIYGLDPRKHMCVFVHH